MPDTDAQRLDRAIAGELDRLDRIAGQLAGQLDRLDRLQHEVSELRHELAASAARVDSALAWTIRTVQQIRDGGLTAILRGRR